jgi:pimeloyl-ACP methyl ester carboxylesterase
LNLVIIGASIVFIHGFTGHPERTWRHKGEANYDQNEPDQDGGERPSKIRKIFPLISSSQRSGARKPTYWPRDLVPIAVPNARVLTYGYDTHIRHWAGPAINKSTVYDIAWDFLVSLEAARRHEPSRPLLLIAHSLGGIIVKEALRQSRGCEKHQSHLYSIYESTSGVIFFGTPHGGADPRGPIQHIAEKVMKVAGFSANEQIVNTLLPSAERLKELRDEFGPMVRQKRWIVYSFQEQYGVKVLGGNKV